MTASRRGLSLTELLVVMTACTALLTLSSGMVCRVMRLHVDSRAYADVERNTIRLSDNFRRDVHRAQSAVTDPTKLGDHDLLRLDVPSGRSIVYSRQDDLVLRQESGPGNPASREEYAFGATFDLVIQELAAPDRIRLTLSTDVKASLQVDPRQSKQGMLVPVHLQVEAVLGRDAQVLAAEVMKDASK